MQSVNLHSNPADKPPHTCEAPPQFPGSDLVPGGDLASQSLTTEKSSRRSFKLSQLGGFMLPHWFGLGIGAIALFIGAAMNLFLPQLLKRFIDVLSLDADIQTSELPNLVVLTLGVFAIQGIAFYIRTRQFGIISHRIAGQLRSAVYDGVLAKPASFFDVNKSGDLATRLSSEVSLVQDVLGVRAIVLLRYGLQVIVGVVMMGLVSTKLTIALVSALLMLVAVGFVFSRSLKEASRAFSSEVGVLTGLFTEALSSVRFLQAHSSLQWISARLDALNVLATQRGETRVGVSATFQSFVSFLLNSALVLLGVYGIVLVSRGELSAGQFGAFVSYAAIVAISFSFFIASISEISQALGAWDRLSDLLPNKAIYKKFGSTVVDKALSAEIRIPPTIQFDEVTFSYGSKEAGVACAAVKNVSFTINPGQHVALVGRSGAGKSTILSLLLGFYRPSQGSLHVRMQKGAESIEQDSLQGLVIYVPQEPQLFGLSLRDNLLVTAPDATDEQLLRALRSARMEETLTRKLLSLDTIIGERGLTLSAGQRQRLALARAFLSNAPVVLLDEPTANLDAENEKAIQAALAELFVGRTTITVAHRFSTIMASDLVLVLDRGELVEQGTPATLMGQSGVFHHLASLQQHGEKRD